MIPSTEEYAKAIDAIHLEYVRRDSGLYYAQNVIDQLIAWLNNSICLPAVCYHDFSSRCVH